MSETDVVPMAVRLQSKLILPPQLSGLRPHRGQPPLLHKISLNGLIIGALSRGARLGIITSLVPSL